ncbi:hypothetical protein JCM11641_007652 [Rhodosporidiobolus odoratus]
MFSDPSPSESEDEGCYVFWETKSILPPAPPAAKPASTSQRSGAPSPSLGTTLNGTPKPKRTTSLASLPSPSSSNSNVVRPLRQRKKRRPIGRNAEPASQPLDAHTLRMVSQLAMKVNARAAGIASPTVTRSGQPVKMPSTVGKGKGKEVLSETVERTLRKPLQPSPNGSANTPLRRQTARTPQTLLTASLTSTKAFLTKPSPLVKLSKVPAVLVPPPLARTSSTIAIDDDEESYFDDFDDSAFELALSQLDETATVATSPPVDSALPGAAKPAAVQPPPPPPAPRLPTVVPAAKVASHPPVRSSPRLARRTDTASMAPVARAGPTGSRQPFRPPPAPVARQPPANSPNPQPRAAPHPIPARPATSVPSAQVKSNLVFRTSGAATRSMTAEKQKEMEELARREAEALVADLELGDGAGWSDDDDF